MLIDRRHFVLGSLAGLALARHVKAEPPMLGVREGHFARGVTNAGLALHRKLGAPTDNLILSPLSIGMAFALLGVGARGATHDELAKVFGFGEPRDVGAAVKSLTATLTSVPDVKVAIANRLFAAASFVPEPAYLEATARDFGAAVERVDFSKNVAAAKVINDWVAAQTQDKIKDLVPPDVLDALTRLVLVNAIYFKASWQIRFEEKKTQPRPFTLADGKNVDTPIMFAARKLEVANSETYQVGRFPYKAGYAMYVLLPKEPAGLAKLEAALDAEKLLGYADVCQRVGAHDCDVWLPRWKARFKVSLPKALREIGLLAPFSPKDADFSGIAPKAREPLYVSDAIHEAFIEVNEEGTEAAAATAIIMPRATSARPPSRPQFKATHPFFYWIQHDATRTVLFTGTFRKP